MYEYLIYSRLKKHAGADKSFHMPGHKNTGDFKSKFPVAPLDVTELSYSDNLHCPKGVIAGAQRDIAKILGAHKSYITTDGSTSGVFAMLYCAAKRGKKVVVMRNSHQSVWNACALLGLEPLIVQGEEREGVLTPPEPQAIDRLVASDETVSAVLVTSPDYYGNVAPLKEYSEITKKYNRLLLVDEAHGAHLFGDRALYAGSYADMWVDGAHKSLATLTQGAVISVNSREIVPIAEEALEIFRTTSPSYPVMASVEYGIKYLANHNDLYNKVRTAAAEFENGFALPVRRTDDKFKIAVDFKSLGISADRVAALLEKKGVYAEFSDGRYILFYLSPLNDIKKLNKLKKQLLAAVRNKNLKGTYSERPPLFDAERTYSFLYAQKSPCELVEPEKSAGRMCARNVGITPPCTPVAVAGEIITPAAIKILTKANNTFGMTDGKICVVKR